MKKCISFTFQLKSLTIKFDCAKKRRYKRSSPKHLNYLSYPPWSLDSQSLLSEKPERNPAAQRDKRSPVLNEASRKGKNPAKLQKQKRKLVLRKASNKYSSCVQSPGRTLNLNLEEAKLRTDFQLFVNSEEVETPHLGSQENNESLAKPDLYTGESFLNKYMESGSVATSNHLYKYNSQTLKREERAQGIKNLANLSVIPVRHAESYAQSKEKDPEVVNKRLLQATPISSNVKNSTSHKLQYEAAITNFISSKKLKFATPSSGGASRTTATSMSKVPESGKPQYKIQSQRNNQSEVISSEMEMKLRATPMSEKKDLMKQSLERIDNAVKRYGKKLRPEDQAFNIQVAKGIKNEHLRTYLQSEGSSMASQVEMHCVPHSGIQIYNSIQREQALASAMCTRDLLDAENFTLGPAEFNNIVVVAQKPAKKVEYNSARKVNENLKNTNRNSRRGSMKYPSADRVMNKGKMAPEFLQ